MPKAAKFPWPAQGYLRKLTKFDVTPKRHQDRSKYTPNHCQRIGKR